MREPDWQSGDGRHKLYLGDCLEILPGLPDGCVDTVVTDPPYGIANRFGVNHSGRHGSRVMQFGWDSAEGVAEGVAEGLRLVGKPGAAFVFCGLDTVHIVQEALRDRGFTPKPYAWIKSCPPPAGFGNWWPSAFELAVYAYQAGAWFGDTVAARTNMFTCDSYRHGRPGKVDHPTQKPLKLVRHIVTSIVKVGGVAIDPFMGSGTTGVACAQLNRSFVGIEIEPKYFKIAVRRIESELAQGKLFTEPEPRLPGAAQARLAFPGG